MEQTERQKTEAARAAAWASADKQRAHIERIVRDGADGAFDAEVVRVALLLVLAELGWQHDNAKPPEE